MQAFKVFRTDGKALYSVATWGPAAVRYVVGEWASPPEFLASEGYGLCVFETLEAALKYVALSGKSEDCVIYSGEARGVLPLLVSRDIFQISSGVRPSRADRVPQGWAEGTMLVKEFRPERQVGVGATGVYLPLRREGNAFVSPAKERFYPDEWRVGLRRVFLHPGRPPKGYEMHPCRGRGVAFSGLAYAVRVEVG